MLGFFFRRFQRKWRNWWSRWRRRKLYMRRKPCSLWRRSLKKKRMQWAKLRLCRSWHLCHCSNAAHPCSRMLTKLCISDHRNHYPRQRQSHWSGRTSTRSWSSAMNNSKKTNTSATNSCSSYTEKWRYELGRGEGREDWISPLKKHVGVCFAAVQIQRGWDEGHSGVSETSQRGAAEQHCSAGRGQPQFEGGNTKP